MTFLKKLTLMHALVFFAFIGFSLRLVEITTGISSLTTPALAEDAAETLEMTEPQSGSEKKAEEAHPPAEDKSKHEEKGVEKGAAKDSAKDTEKDTEKEAEKDKPEHEVETPQWLDSSDSDMKNESIRMEIMQDLAESRGKLDQREKELITREALLQAAEKELDRKYQELAQLRGEIEKLLQQQSEEEKERITSLVKVYEGMKPQDSARIFDTLDLDVLLSVMGQMSERKMSPILAAMNPERARTVTIMLAEQKQLPQLPQN